MFKRIDHIELLTAEPERTIDFYLGVLGFRERERTRIPETPSGPLDLVYLELGGTTVEVMCRREKTCCAATPSDSHRTPSNGSLSSWHGSASAARSSRSTSPSPLLAVPCGWR